MSIVTSMWQFKSLVAVLGDSLNLQKKARNGLPLGENLANAIAYSIITQSDKGLDPKGRRWPALSPKYRRWKLLHGHDPRINFMEDKMLDFLQVKGIVVISKDAMTMFYGISQFEQQKADWAHRGRLLSGWHAPQKFSWGRPPRPFYELNRQSKQRIDDICDQQIDDVIMSLGATRIP